MSKVKTLLSKWGLVLSPRDFGLARNHLFLFIVALVASVSCSHKRVRPEISACANIDWYESGREDGIQGYGLEKLNEHRGRCDSTAHPVDLELYTNGREAGLIEFCTPAGGLIAGQNGSPYEGVCPRYLEKAFLSSYEIGKRIHSLENENASLESRLSGIFRSTGSLSRGNSDTQSEIDKIKSRRAQIDAEINKLVNSIDVSSSRL